MKCGIQRGLLIPVGILFAAVGLVGDAPGAEAMTAVASDQKEACLSCHDLDGLSAKVQHEPAEQGACSACHNPHVSRFASLLRDRPAPLCQGCHAGLGGELDRAVVHQPVEEGRCFDCHEPHGSEHAGLLVQSYQELCASCHDAVVSWGQRPVQHVPFARGNCSECHVPHASESVGLVKGRGSRLCLACHSPDGQFRAAHQSYPVEKAACQQCHDPHSAARKGMFRETLHMPFSDGGCEDCHASATAPDPFATIKPQDQLCGDCHEDQVAASRAAPFPHVSAGGQGCSSCHNPHAGDGSGMLRAGSIDTCLACHDPGGSSLGEEFRHRSHGGEGEQLECSVCHASHGGDQPVLLADDPVVLCGGCHEHQHGVTHPLGEETRDPRNGTPMTCLSCHGMHSSGHEMYLLGTDQGELCLGCHKEIGGGRS